MSVPQFLRDMVDNFEVKVQVKETIYCWAVLKPQAKQSTRVGRYGGFTDAKKAAYLKELTDQLRGNLQGKDIEGNVRATVIFGFEGDVVDDLSQWEYFRGGPDIDNLQKPTYDCIFSTLKGNDRCIVEARVRKCQTGFSFVVAKLEQIVRAPD